MENAGQGNRQIKKLYVPIVGTKARQNYKGGERWFDTGSPFDLRANGRNLVRVEQDRDPSKPDRGYWSGDLEGLLVQRSMILFSAFTRQKVNKWDIGAHELSTLMLKRQEEWADQNVEITLIGHSHGGQVACLTLERLRRTSFCLPVRLITVDMPVRESRFVSDMHLAYKAAQVMTAQWLHLYSNWWNPYRLFGSGFGPSKCPYATENIHIRGGHSNVLYHPVYMDQLIHLL